MVAVAGTVNNQLKAAAEKMVAEGNGHNNNNKKLW